MAPEPVDVEQLLRQLGSSALLQEAESLGCAPRGSRLRCPWPGCRDQGAERARNATVHGQHPRVHCFRCGQSGDLVDLLKVSRGLERGEAIRELSGLPPPPRPALRVVPSAPSAEADPEKLTPAEVARAWDACAHDDEEAEAYLAGRGLARAAELGLVRFVPTTHPDRRTAGQARRGYRVAALLSDVVGNPRGIQLRHVGEPLARQPKILSVHGSSTSRAFFGAPDGVEAAPVVAVGEGLADTLALGVWASGRDVAVVGAAGKNQLVRLAEELAAAGVPLQGKVFALFPQNDRPRNLSRREFVRLGQALTRLGAQVVLCATHAEHKDVASWRAAEPEAEWPPAELERALRPTEEERPPDAPAVLGDMAVALPPRVSVEAFGQNFSTLCTLLDDPVHSEGILGQGELSWCDMTWRVRVGGRELTEPDLSAVRLALEGVRTLEGKPLQFQETDIARALAMLARRRRVHPVRDWLEGLRWAGKELVDVELPLALGWPAGSFEATLLRRWMLSAGARALWPGCKVDTTFVLVGAQGLGKSAFFSAIAGDGSWFTDSPVRTDDKDGKLVMRRAWVVEWGELDSMRRARDLESVKTFLSSRVDVFRKPYGRDVVEAPRHCVIVGSTNLTEFLHDPTGSRRFWPAQVAVRIDLAWVRQHREQLWAEVVRALKGGEQWWLTDAESLELVAHSMEHQASDVWADPVEHWLSERLAFDTVTTTQVLAEAIGLPLERQGRPEEMRVGKIMADLGWERKRRRRLGGGGVGWVYARK